MQPDATVQLQAIIDRILAGDRPARRELLERACERLRKLAARMLNASFPALRNRHELDSVVHETWIWLVQALDKTEPPTVADFFRLAAFKIRQVLLDMAERKRKEQSRELLGLAGGSASSPPLEPAQATYDPSRLAQWTEFHDKVDALPEDERAVFDMHFYLELPQAEIGRVLNLHPRKISYLWVAATEKLADHLSWLNG